MRFQSKKQAAIYREWSPKRKLYLEDNRRCMVCANYSTEVHEIFSGPLRMKAFVEIAAWLAVCTYCNQNPLTDRVEYPIERQLAIKLLNDPKNFDLTACRRIITPRQIDLESIINWLHRTIET
jgi:hypothetical protein